MSIMASTLTLRTATAHICRSMRHRARAVQRLCEGARLLDWYASPGNRQCCCPMTP